MNILAYVTDLIFAAKIASTGQALGVGVRLVRSVESLTAALAAGPCDRLLVDLNAGGDPIGAIRAARGRSVPPRIVAFGSHVQTDLLAAARDAGADAVMARSEFSSRLPELLGHSVTN